MSVGHLRVGDRPLPVRGGCGSLPRLPSATPQTCRFSPFWRPRVQDVDVSELLPGEACLPGSPLAGPPHGFSSVRALRDRGSSQVSLPLPGGHQSPQKGPRLYDIT